MTTPITSTLIMKPHGLLASERLDPGSIYTRNELSTLFDIKDATLNNGIFRPKGYDSVWLFITEHKTSDRVQYADRLRGDTLYMQGQRLGRTDTLILEHRKRGLELLLFHRKSKYEYPYAGFRYVGIFSYKHHSGSNPTSFILSRNLTATQISTLNRAEQKLVSQGEFTPNNLRDARIRIETSIVRRRGQSEFRRQLLRAYQGRCAMTGCSLQQVLEAAHIHPYMGDETDVVPNGIILRSDVHTLFDLGLLWVRPPDLLIGVSEELRLSEYSTLEGNSIYLPENRLDQPSRPALEFRYNNITKRFRPT